MKRLLSYVQFVSISGFLVAEVVQLVQHGDTGFAKARLLNALTWLIGVNLLVSGSGDLVMPDPIAESIGWGTGSPFQ